MEYKPIEKRMLQLQKVSEVFQGNVERLSNINKSLIGFHSVFSEFLAATKAAATRLDVPEPVSIKAQERASRAKQAKKENATPQAPAGEAPARRSTMKKAPVPKRTGGKKAAAEPVLTGPQRAQAALKALVPAKFQGEGHLKHMYRAMQAVGKHEDGASVASIATDTMIGKVQLDEYLTVLSRCGQLSKNRTNGLRYTVSKGSVLEGAAADAE